MGLDSIYAMLARPVKAIFQPKREVEQVKTSSAIAPDSTKPRNRNCLPK